MTRGRVILALALGGILALWLLLRPIPFRSPAPVVPPARSYAEALDRLRRLEARDDSVRLYAPCHTFALVHGARTARCYVFLHGFTNCPRQFGRLAELLHGDGANVVVPRLPRHGIENAPRSVLRRLAAAELIATSEEAVAIAHGLGERVSVVGLSSSAIVAAWLAETHADLDQVMLIAPSFAPKGISEGAAVRLTSALFRLPDFYVLWNPKRKAPVGPKSAYPGFSSRALASVYQLGARVLEDAGKAPYPRARALIVTTAHDEGVNNAITMELARRWAEGGVRVEPFEFPVGAGVRHDMIDPEQPYQRVALIYPVIRRFLMTGRPPRLDDSTSFGDDAPDGALDAGRKDATTSASSAPSQGASKK